MCIVPAVVVVAAAAKARVVLLLRSARGSDAFLQYLSKLHHLPTTLNMLSYGTRKLNEFSISNFYALYIS